MPMSDKGAPRSLDQQVVPGPYMAPHPTLGRKPRGQQQDRDVTLIGTTSRSVPLQQRLGPPPRGQGSALKACRAQQSTSATTRLAITPLPSGLGSSREERRNTPLTNDEEWLRTINRPMTSSETSRAVQIIKQRSIYNRGTSTTKSAPTSIGPSRLSWGKRPPPLQPQPEDRLGLLSFGLRGERFRNSKERFFCIWAAHTPALMYQLPPKCKTNRNRLRNAAAVWQARFPDSPWTRMIVEHNAQYHWDFEMIPVQGMMQRPRCRVKAKDYPIAHATVHEWQDKRYVRWLGPMADQTDFGQPGVWYSSLTMAPKKSRDGTIKMRTCVDFFNLNLWSVVYPSHKMESAKRGCEILYPWAWLTQADQAEYYLLGEVDLATRRVMRFVLRDPLGVLQAYEFQVVAFGAHPASHWMGMLKRPPIQALRRSGMVMATIMDDDNIVSPCFAQALRDAKKYFKEMDELGFVFQLKKVSRWPTRRLMAFGNLWCTRTMHQFDAVWKLLQIRQLAKRVSRDVRRNRPIRMKTWASLKGRQVARMLTCYTARMNHFFIHHLQVAGVHEVGWNGHLRVPPRDRSRILNELRLIQRSTQLWHSRRLKLTWNETQDMGLEVYPLHAEYHATTDASPIAIGGWIMETNQRCRIEFTRQASQESSNHRESSADVAVLKALVRHNNLYNTVVHLFSDNTTDISYMNKHGGKNIVIGGKIVPFLRWMYYNHRVRQCTSHIPGMINEQSDWESRDRTGPSEYKLSTKAQKAIFRAWGYPDLDCMATSANQLEHQPWFISWRLDPHSAAMDLFSGHPYISQLLVQAECPYLFPPEHPMFILRALRLVQRLHLQRAIFVAPVWVNHTWWALLTSMAISLPILLKEGSVVPPTQQETKPTQRKWRVAAWLLSASAARSAAFRTQLCSELPLHTQGGTAATTSTVHGWLGSDTAANTTSKLQILTTLTS